MESETFKGLSKLERLKLRKCSEYDSEEDWVKYKEKRKNLFIHLKKLTSIDFDRTALLSIDADVFNGLYQLKTITLSQNHLRKIDLNALNGGLINLKKFYSSHNDLETVNLQCFPFCLN